MSTPVTGTIIGPYAQTNLQLLNQLRAEGYPPDEVVRSARAYDLAMELFAGAFRPSGKAFLAHLVGTASILASLRAPGSVVAAGLLHAAYSHGDFGPFSLRYRDRRSEVRRAIGEDAEQYVDRYRWLAWNERTIPALCEGVDRLDPIDRQVVLIRLANALEDQLDLGLLYCRKEEGEAYFRRCGAELVRLAEALGQSGLAAGLTRVAGEAAAVELPSELESARITSFVQAPRSFMRRPSSIIRRLLEKGLRRHRAARA